MGTYTYTSMINPFESRLRLRGTKKYTMENGIVLTRIKSAKDTLNDIIPLCKTIGITRISDITHLDRLSVPNYSTVLPGTEDSIWVYSGKGITKAHAKASALMEAIERYSSLHGAHARSFVRGNFLELSSLYRKVLHPDEVVEPVNREFNDHATIDFLNGYDLLADEDVLVPAQLALSKYSAISPAIYAFPYSHTNGLASGNTLEEAICHALCEVIERDASSIADLCASSISYDILKKIMDMLKIEANEKSLIRICLEEKFVDDPSIFSDVDISEVVEEFEPLKNLISKFIDAHIPLLIKNITQNDIGIPTFAASSIEWVTSDYGYFAKGYGTHPDRRIALIRAITEVAQTRAGNIQGARDDLKKIEYKQSDEIYKRKWQFMPATSLNKQNDSKIVKFSEIKTSINMDILDDIRFILSSLKKAGVKRAIIVDLTSPNLGIPVVRAIIPGLETFEVAKYFMSSASFMGPRAKRDFMKTLRR